MNETKQETRLAILAIVVEDSSSVAELDCTGSSLSVSSHLIVRGLADTVTSSAVPE